MSDQFVVDWQAGDYLPPPANVVSLRMRGRKAGLYRVRAMMPKGVLLSHGAISFPVGTQLDVEDVLGILPGDSINHAHVVANDQRGVSLAW